MSAIPGMADGRALGLAPYMNSSEINNKLQATTKLANGQKYREYLQQNQTNVLKFYDDQLAVPPVDFWCPSNSQANVTNVKQVNR